MRAECQLHLVPISTMHYMRGFSLGDISSTCFPKNTCSLQLWMGCEECSIKEDHVLQKITLSY